MNILHFAGNAGCIPWSHDLFEQALPTASRWRVLGWPTDRNRDALVGVTSDYFFGPDARADLEWADLLICHSMHPQFMPAVLQIPEHVVLLWRLWGFEYQHFRERELGSLYLKDTAVIRRNMVMKGAIGGGFRRVIAGLKTRLRRRLAQSGDGLAAIGARVDLVTGFRGEIEIVKRSLQGFRAKPVRFSYRCLNDPPIFRLIGGPRGERGVQVGNSATFTNNHIEAMASLDGLVPAGESVLAPLNYGDMQYAAIVERRGQAVFDKAFRSLRTPLPLAEYNTVLQSTCAFVMNSRVQQGMGNIFQALQDGRKVFLRPENVMLKNLREDGFHIHSTEALEQGGKDALGPLPLFQQRENYDRVVEALAPRVVLDEIRALESAVQSLGRRRDE